MAVERALEFAGKSERPFDAWFCLGDLLSPSMTAKDYTLLKSIVSGEYTCKKGYFNLYNRYYFIIVPMPVYFAIRDRISGMNEELLNASMIHNDNVKFLDSTCFFTLPNGLNTAIISGIDNSCNSIRAEANPK